NHFSDQQNLTDFLKRGGKRSALGSAHKRDRENRSGENRKTGSQELAGRHYHMQTGLKPVWAGRNMRLDPFRLPQAVSYATRDEQGDVTFMIDQRGAVIRRVLERSGLPATIFLPARAFRGVAARAIEDSEGNVTVTLELLHNDPQLSVPLLVADDLDDIAADWRTWAEEYRLPMLLIEA